MLADVGCGNGKYQGVNPEVIAVSIEIYYFDISSKIIITVKCNKPFMYRNLTAAETGTNESSSGVKQLY